MLSLPLDIKLLYELKWMNNQSPAMYKLLNCLLLIQEMPIVDHEGIASNWEIYSTILNDPAQFCDKLQHYDFENMHKDTCLRVVNHIKDCDIDVPKMKAVCETAGELMIFINLWVEEA